MANSFRGEVAFEIDGQPRVLRLTLQGLAELEGEWGADGLLALARRLVAGPISARDILTILAAGCAGGGHALSAEELGQRIPASRLPDAAEAAIRLIASSLDVDPLGGGSPSHPPPPQVA
jgi:Phage tail tube protein, GTA-gp10